MSFLLGVGFAVPVILWGALQERSDRVPSEKKVAVEAILTSLPEWTLTEKHSSWHNLTSPSERYTLELSTLTFLFGTKDGSYRTIVSYNYVPVSKIFSILDRTRLRHAMQCRIKASQVEIKQTFISDIPKNIF